ncbi:hypothetical protein DPEC_G00005900 [Dallia pectoralis]|uniref:Uncharacterized protein n=1 Tax=Dallia pectoralis TaxID=75939 RepID=A0ACC2HLG1_DALPE|nr:hypothetical protein DPEC_G00005900 [Dallia pectoralis]
MSRPCLSFNSWTIRPARWLTLKHTTKTTNSQFYIQFQAGKKVDYLKHSNHLHKSFVPFKMLIAVLFFTFVNMLGCFW